MAENSDASSKNLQSELKKINCDAVETAWKNLEVSGKSSTRSTSDHAKTSSIRHAVSIELRLMTDTYIDRQLQYCSAKAQTLGPAYMHTHLIRYETQSSLGINEHIRNSSIVQTHELNWKKLPSIEIGPTAIA